MADKTQTEKDRLMAKRRAAGAAAARARSAPETASPVQVTEDMIQKTVSIAVVSPTKQNGATASIALPQVDRSREITEKDVTIPKLKIAQSMSKVVQDGIVPLGNWYHTSRNRDLGKEVLIIPADMQKTRSYFVQGSGVMCRSFDFVMGEGTPGGLCEGTVQEQSTAAPGEIVGCPLRVWGKRDEKTGRSERPKCGENYNFAVIIIEDPEDEDSRLLRGILTFRGTGITSGAKPIITMKVEDDYDWWDMVIKVRLAPKTNPLGTFQVPEVEFVDESTKYPAARARAIKLSRVMNSALVRATLEADPE